VRAGVLMRVEDDRVVLLFQGFSHEILGWPPCWRRRCSRPGRTRIWHGGIRHIPEEKE
jgi:hypothetical protein